MGAIDLVVQIEAPPSVASGLQRIGRGGHQVDAVSEGIIFPKFRGDLVACAAVAQAMHDGAVEATRYPRNPLDVARAADRRDGRRWTTWHVDDLFATDPPRGAVRRAEPRGLRRRARHAVGPLSVRRVRRAAAARHLGPRRAARSTAREGAKRVAIANGGTIPDRGLYGVFLAGAAPGAARVGELDEEMVFESRVGETFVLGASTWRIEEITHDRVLVSPAPGEPGKMPFWKGDRAGRPLELGLAIGRLVRDLLRLPPRRRDRAADARPRSRRRAPPRTCCSTCAIRCAAARAVPDDRTIVIERVPRRARRLARLRALAARRPHPRAVGDGGGARRSATRPASTSRRCGATTGSSCGFRTWTQPPDPRLLLPDPGRGRRRSSCGSSARRRSSRRSSARTPARVAAAAEAPRPGMRAPLWQQRKRAADLLAVASRFGSFPMLLETYRECLRDFFDMPALVVDARPRSAAGRSASSTVDSETPSPFAASLLFSYVANFLYDGDAPLAERRAQALAVDQAQLRELLGDAELRELLDADVDGRGRAAAAAARRAATTPRAPTACTTCCCARRSLPTPSSAPASALTAEVAGERRRASSRAGRIAAACRSPGEPRFIAVEDAARYRDALGVPLPAGHSRSRCWSPCRSRSAISRCATRARTRRSPAPSSRARYGLGTAAAEAVLDAAGHGRAAARRRVPARRHAAASGRDADVLRMLRRRSLAKLRHEVEPVDQAALGRFATTWQGVTTPRRRRRRAARRHRAAAGRAAAGVDSRDARSCRRARRATAGRPRSADGRGRGGLGRRRAARRSRRPHRALPQPTTCSCCCRPAIPRPSGPPCRAHPRASGGGASFFPRSMRRVAVGFQDEVVDALWDLAWRGLSPTTRCTRCARSCSLPARTRPRAAGAPVPVAAGCPPEAQGRWTLTRP